MVAPGGPNAHRTGPTVARRNGPSSCAIPLECAVAAGPGMTNTRVGTMIEQKGSGPRGHTEAPQGREVAEDYRAALEWAPDLFLCTALSSAPSVSGPDCRLRSGAWRTPVRYDGQHSAGPPNRPSSHRNSVRHASGRVSAITPESCTAWAGARTLKGAERIRRPILDGQSDHLTLIGRLE
jgi:hypothetical protein